MKLVCDWLAIVQWLFGDLTDKRLLDNDQTQLQLVLVQAQNTGGDLLWSMT